MSTVICGFPGVGKSTAAAHCADIVDVESSVYRYPADENGFSQTKAIGWENHYADYIRGLYTAGRYEYILVSTHDTVREKLEMRNVPYLIVVPEATLKDEYLVRYLKRGDPVEFIRKMNDHWWYWLHKIEEKREEVPTIHLGKGEFLADILPYSIKVGDRG